MARALAESDSAAALVWAQAALAAFERMGATQDADAAAQLLRELGAPRRSGTPSHASSTGREADVLALVAVGSEQSRNCRTSRHQSQDSQSIMWVKF